jgi:hypothetical protein
MPSERPKGEVVHLVPKKEKGVHSHPEAKDSFDFSPESFGTQITEYILSVNPNIKIEGPISIKMGYGKATFEIPVSSEKKLINARGTVQFTLYSYLLSQMIKAESREIEAGAIDKKILSKLLPPSSFLDFPIYLKEYLEKQNPGRDIAKIIITESGAFRAVFKRKDGITAGPIFAPANGSEKLPPIGIHTAILDAVEQEDNAEAERLTAAREAKRSKDEMKAQAAIEKAKELLGIPRVLELKAFYEKRRQESTLPGKKKDAEDNLLALSDAKNLFQYFSTQRVFNSKDAKALDDIKRINAKYDPILEDTGE